MEDEVHRDIAPFNIMYDTEAEAIKLTDFHIARVTDWSKRRAGALSPGGVWANASTGGRISSPRMWYFINWPGAHCPSRARIATLMDNIVNQPPVDINPRVCLPPKTKVANA